MNEEKLKEALSDEAFVKELLAMEKPEDVQAALEEKGVEFTLDDIKQIGEVIRKVQSGEISQEQLERAANGELSEDELEGVSGGILLTTLLWITLGCGVAVGIGGGIAIGITKNRW